MARLDQIPEPMRSLIAAIECLSFKTQPWIEGPLISRRRVAIVSTAGLHHRDDRPFTFMAGDYRIIPGDIKMNDEAVTAQPGQGSPESDRLAGWFWGEKVAAEVLLTVKQSCLKSDDTMLQGVGMKLLIPMTQSQHSSNRTPT